MEFIRKTQVKESSTKKSRSSYGIFLCPFCGKEVEKQLSQGRRIRSCGCHNPNPNLTHGETRRFGSGRKNHLYGVWQGIKSRCSNPNTARYPHYGGRGITLCDEWQHSYESFAAWAKDNGWRRGLQIDRVNNDAGYSPENCRVTTPTENIRNSTRTKLTLDAARSIRRRFVHRKVTREMLAEEYSISVSTVGRVLSNKLWKELP